jgi:hypothetical protein
MYFSPSRKSMIAAFRGTAGVEDRNELYADTADLIQDIWTDLKQFGSGFSVHTDQARLAVEFCRAAHQFEGYRLIGATGHSLGGGLAHVAAVKLRIPAVGFNPAPFDSFADFDINQHSDSLRFLHSYISENDFVSNASILALFSKNRGLGVSGLATVVSGATGGHSMVPLAKRLKHSPEGQHQPFAWTPPE